jgi:hypothetical protein
VIAENRAVAQQLFDRLGGWLDELGVPPARKQQLLNNAPFSRWDKLKYSLWLSKNHFSYWKKYRHYDRGAYSA